MKDLYALDEVFASFPKEERYALRLYSNGCSYAEISRLMNWKKGKTNGVIRRTTSNLFYSLGFFQMKEGQKRDLVQLFFARGRADEKFRDKHSDAFQFFEELKQAQG